MSRHIARIDIDLENSMNKNVNKGELVLIGLTNTNTTNI